MQVLRLQISSRNFPGSVMVKFLITALMSSILGIGLGYAKASFTQSGKEKFLGSRTTIAESTGEMTREEIIKQAKEKGKPHLEVIGGTDYDFGMMMHGSQLDHDFIFRNNGDGPLVLEMGESSCKCTVGELDSSVLQPGEETIVNLSWKAQVLTKTFGQSATIKTNDTDQLEVKLSVFGEISRSVATVPDAIELGSISDTETVNRTFYIFSYIDDIDEIQQMTWTHEPTRELVELTTEEIGVAETGISAHKNAKKAFKVDMKISPGLRLGPVSTRVQFKTNRGDDIGVIGLAVKGKVAGRLELRGGPSFEPRNNLLTIGTVNSSEGASVSIFLFVQGDDHADVVPAIDSTDPADSLTASIGEAKRSDSKSIFPVTITVPKGAPEGNFPARGKSKGGVVRIKTKGDSPSELRINVRMAIKD